MQRNKTVSSLRNIRDERKRAKDNSRTLKANKSMGHFLRKEKTEKEIDKTEINLESRKKIDLKYISMTPKRKEKENNFYTKTDARSNINKNKALNGNKNEKRKTYSTISRKEEKIKKLINKKEEPQELKTLDIGLKANKRPSRQNVKEKSKNEIKKIDKLDNKINENKNKSKIDDNKKDKIKKIEKKFEKKEVKKDDKMDDKKDAKKDSKKEVKKEDKKEIKKEDKKDVKKENKKEIKKEEKKDVKKENEKDIKEDFKKEEQKEDKNENKENVKKEEKNEIKKEENKVENLNEGKEQEIKNEINNEDKLKNDVKKDINNIQNKIESVENNEQIKPKIEQNNKLSKFVFHRLINCYDKIIKFLNNEEQKNLLLISKDSALTIIPIFKEINLKKLQENENALNQFKLKNKEEDYKSPIPPFQLGKAGLKALEKLNEENYHKLFISEEIPNKDIIFIYRLFLQLINKNNEILPTNDSEFWKLAKNRLFDSKKDKFGDHIKELAQQLNLSDENIKIVDNMCKNNMEKLTPKYYNSLCPTTPLFFLLIKEILEYCGILVGKKTPIPMEYKKLEYDLKILKEKEEIINKIAEKAHKKKSLFKK